MGEIWASISQYGESLCMGRPNPEPTLAKLILDQTDELNKQALDAGGAV